MTIYIIDVGGQWQSIPVDLSSATVALVVTNMSGDQLVVAIGAPNPGNSWILPRDAAITFPVGATDDIAYPAGGLFVSGSTTGQAFDVTVT